MATRIPDNQFVRGAEKLSQRIQSIRKKLDLPALTDEIADLLVRRTKDRFDKEVDPNQLPWKDLAPATLAEKERKGYGSKGKLKRTESLRNSIRRIRGNPPTGATYAQTGAGARIGVTDPTQFRKARAHQVGTQNIPARRFLGVGRLDVKAVDSLMRRKAVQLNKEI